MHQKIPEMLSLLVPEPMNPLSIRPHGWIVVYHEMSLNQRKFRVLQCPLETKTEKQVACFI